MPINTEICIISRINTGLTIGICYSNISSSFLAAVRSAVFRKPVYVRRGARPCMTCTTCDRYNGYSRRNLHGYIRLPKAMKRLRELETKLEDLQKQITIEKAKSAFRLSKADIIRLYKAGLEKEPKNAGKHGIFEK